MLGSSVDAEDAVQETLLRAWRASRRFEGRAAVRTWLYRIATNVCLDSLGHAARRPIPVEDVTEPAGAGGEPDPSDDALERERLRLAIVIAVGALPPRQRAVLLLRDVLSWRASEVADLLGMTTVGVNSTLQRARAALDAVDPERRVGSRQRCRARARRPVRRRVCDRRRRRARVTVTSHLNHTSTVWRRVRSAGDRDERPVEGLRLGSRAVRARPRGSAGRGVRLPRAQRRGQVDHDAAAAGPDQADLGLGAGARAGHASTTASRSAAGSAFCPAISRCIRS